MNLFKDQNESDTENNQLGGGKWYIYDCKTHAKDTLKLQIFE